MAASAALAPLLWDESPCRARCSTPQDRIAGTLSSSISPSSPPAPLSPPPLSCPLRAQGSVLGGSSAVWEERWQILSHAQPALCRALLRQLTSPAASLPKCSSSPDRRFVSNSGTELAPELPDCMTSSLDISVSHKPRGEGKLNLSRFLLRQLQQSCTCQCFTRTSQGRKGSIDG